MYYDIGAFDTIYDEFEKLCRVAWSEKFNYLYIDMSENKMKANIVFSTKAKPHISIVFRKLNFFENI